MPAVLLNPVLADGARVVLAATPKHWPNRLVDKERAADSHRPKAIHNMQRSCRIASRHAT